ncbi:hypothetical protein DPMN_102622 [Dreissena polymorpha]|uniref:C2H2-type domain-containing protein n=2 Tax=Dreissena polymorpha TaxID=45954 RepID=A0A9D4R987_DREPO|nr:hypothetical protein DPMN_102622 [Dreissena polymorpha]
MNSSNKGHMRYACEVCQRRFSRPSHMEQHMRIHTGDKPYQCAVCQQRFTLKHHLKGHQIRHLQM